MRENKVVYGLIGYGSMGRWHTEILSNVPEAESVASMTSRKKREKKRRRRAFLYMKQKKPCWQIRISMWF